MKNLFSNILYKKDKNKETKEKEKPKINEIVIDIELPTGQADPQFDFEINRDVLI